MKFDPEALKSHQIHELFVGCVTPRPIAFVSTVESDGINNVAPFIFFTMVALNPPLTGFSIGHRRGEWCQEGQANEHLEYFLRLLELAIHYSATGGHGGQARI